MHAEVLQKIYDHVEQGEVDKAVRASLRLSRLIRDDINTAMFLRELIYDNKEFIHVLYDDINHLKPEAQNYICKYSSERWIESRTLPFSLAKDPDNGNDLNIFTTPVGEFPGELLQCEKSIEDLVVPPTMGAYDSAAFTDRYDRHKAKYRLRIRAINAIKDRILNRCQNFAIIVERQWAAQEKSVQFLQVVQNEVQNYFKSRSLDVYEKLQKANQLINANSTEDLSLLLTEVRRSFKATADYFFPPKTGLYECIDGKIRALGDDQYMNRLYEFVYTKFPRSTSTDLLRAELDYFLIFAKKLNDIASKGVHSSVSAAEAKQGFLGLYLFLYNICQKLEYSSTPE